MLVVAIVPVIVALIGLVMYLIASRADVKEIGRIMFGCGLLVTLFVVARETVSVGR